MKTIGASVTIGTLIALAIIYWLRPLPPGAVALVVILCIGLAAAVGTIFSRKSKAKGDK